MNMLKLAVAAGVGVAVSICAPASFASTGATTLSALQQNQDGDVEAAIRRARQAAERARQERTRNENNRNRPMSACERFRRDVANGRADHWTVNPCV